MSKIDDKKIENKAEKYFAQYKPFMESLEKSPLAKARGISLYDYYALGSMLESWDTYKEICEEDGTVGHLGRIPQVAHDVITVGYGASPITLISSVQPIEEEVGTVYYKKVVAEDTRGNITAGDTLIDPKGVGSVPIGYANSSQAFNAVTLVTGTDTYNWVAPGTPLRRFAQVITVTVGSQVVRLQDDGEGNLMGYKAWGTIDYNTGAVSVTFDTAFAGTFAGGEQVVHNAAQDFELSDVPQIQLRMATREVRADIYALKSTVGLFQSFAMRRRFGLVGMDEATNDLVAAINSELVATAISKLQAAIPTTAVTWPKTAPAGVSYAEHKLSLLDYIADMESTMLGAAERGAINILVAGRNAAAILGTLPGFAKISDSTTIGPHVYGTINGMMVVRVPNTNMLNPNRIIGMYRSGSSAFESALTYAPYMPLTVTSALPMDNPLQTQKAVAVWGAVAATTPEFAAILDITP